MSVSFSEPAGARERRGSDGAGGGGVGGGVNAEKRNSLARQRSSSPPPPGAYQKRVAFDTFTNKDAADFSFTLQTKHRDFTYGRRTRTFLCGTDQNEYSSVALEWLLEELVDDNDIVVCLRVVEPGTRLVSDISILEMVYREEAEKLLETIKGKNTKDRAISLILEFSVGKIEHEIQRMTHMYEPIILVVGTKGRSLNGLQGLMPGSISKYCLQYSPVPVIVVRPESKRLKRKRQRQADPLRVGYIDILEEHELGD